MCGGASVTMVLLDSGQNPTNRPRLFQAIGIHTVNVGVGGQPVEIPQVGMP